MTSRNKCTKATVINFHWNNTRPCINNGKCLSNRRPPRDANSVTAAGLWASNSRNTSIWPESIRLGMRRVVMATGSVTVMEYYFYLRAGTRTSHTERWWALSSRYSLLLGCWPFGFPITLILKTGERHRSHFYWNTSIPERYGAERNEVVYFLRISKVPGVGPGEELHGTASDYGN